MSWQLSSPEFCPICGSMKIELRFDYRAIECSRCKRRLSLDFCEEMLNLWHEWKVKPVVRDIEYGRTLCLKKTGTL